ncbi:hypothetical protein GWI33_020301 [Rhynchophorus ferrugineus]|uniref:Secreted protein n=1 Tax=Rhynchophorus ferrugineus TaxID=354439 RepID=A0A834HPK5_RHYFE|nr:hypothetical protein GWI33_020301 [Rhynchophorus ferrugineus]
MLIRSLLTVLKLSSIVLNVCVHVYREKIPYRYNFNPKYRLHLSSALHLTPTSHIVPSTETNSCRQYYKVDVDLDLKYLLVLIHAFNASFSRLQVQFSSLWSPSLSVSPFLHSVLRFSYPKTAVFTVKLAD